MHRNLDRRVEALVRLTDPAQVDELLELFDLSVADTTSSWHLQPDGTWVRHDRDEDGEPLADLQDVLIQRQRAQLSSARAVGS